MPIYHFEVTQKRRRLFHKKTTLHLSKEYNDIFTAREDIESLVAHHGGPDAWDVEFVGVTEAS